MADYGLFNAAVKVAEQKLCKEASEHLDSTLKKLTDSLTSRSKRTDRRFRLIVERRAKDR